MSTKEFFSNNIAYKNAIRSLKEKIGTGKKPLQLLCSEVEHICANPDSPEYQVFKAWMKETLVTGVSLIN